MVVTTEAMLSFNAEQSNSQLGILLGFICSNSLFVQIRIVLTSFDYVDYIS